MPSFKFASLSILLVTCFLLPTMAVAVPVQFNFQSTSPPADFRTFSAFFEIDDGVLPTSSGNIFPLISNSGVTYTHPVEGSFFWSHTHLSSAFTLGPVTSSGPGFGFNIAWIISPDNAAGIDVNSWALEVPTPGALLIIDDGSGQWSVVPEPSMMLLFGTGLAGLAVWRWKRGTQA